MACTKPDGFPRFRKSYFDSQDDLLGKPAVAGSYREEEAIYDAYGASMHTVTPGIIPAVALKQ